MGSPIAHTLSPALHRAAYQALGLDWTYDAREVDEPALSAAMDEVAATWVGASLTRPLKQAVLPLLDEVSELAGAVGAVNTVTFGADGQRYGDNTDVHGIVAALQAAGPTRAGEAVVLGGGATAASAVAALHDLGHPRAAVVVRSRERAGGVAAAAERLGVDLRFAAWDRAGELAAAADVLVSTLPPAAADAVLPPGTTLTGHGAPGGVEQAAAPVLLDVVYRPWPTPIADAWTRAGGVAVPGLEMLLHQAAAQITRWTGLTPDLSVMRRAAAATTR